MSLSDSNQNVRTYPVIASAQSQVPQELMSSNAPRPLPSRLSHKQSISSTATQSQSGTLMFQIPCGSGAGFMKSGSVYLQCRVTGVGQTTANDYWLFQNANQLGSSIILRDTLYINGNIADQYNYLSKLRSSLVSHCSSESYVKNDLSVLEGANQRSTLVGANPATQQGYIDICIPVQNGVLNAQHNLPLFLLNTCNIEFNLETVANAIQSVVHTCTDYVVSNAKLIYSVVQPEVSFEQEMRSILASGKLYQMPIKSWYNLKQSNNVAGAKSIQIGLNMSSVNGIFHCSSTLNGDGLTRVYNYGDGPTNFRVWTDGQLVNNFNLDTASIQFAEMKKALGVFGDPERASCGPTDGTAAATDGLGSFSAPLSQFLYQTKVFLGGMSLLRTQEGGFEMSGSGVSVLLSEITNTGSAGDLYIFVSYSQILTIDQFGSTNMIR